MLRRLAAALLASKTVLVASWYPAAAAALLLVALGAQEACAVVWQLMASYVAVEMKQHCRGKQLSLYMQQQRHSYYTHLTNSRMLIVVTGVAGALWLIGAARAQPLPTMSVVAEKLMAVATSVLPGQLFIQGIGVMLAHIRRLVAAEEAAKRRSAKRPERQPRSKQASLPAEPPADDAEAINLMVRLPAGGRYSRRFRRSDPLQAVFDFVDVQSGVGGDIAPGTYHLATAFPRRVLEDGASAKTLEEAGLSAKKEALFLELK